MTAMLEVIEAGPAVTLQDLGRSGHIARGLTRGGAMDRLALHEAAALLSQPVSAALEMIGMGGAFRVTAPTRIALTGAPMTASVDGAPIAWHGTHWLDSGAVLRIGGVRGGAIGYLSFGGGVAEPELMGAQSAHLAAGLGTILSPGDRLALCGDPGGPCDLLLDADDRFSGGEIAIVTSLQSHLFGAPTLTRFAATRFTRDARANRQGIRLTPEGDGFAAEGGLRIVSEIITPGDIQITGDGAPYVLMCESQTTGGYPRIASVLPSDLPRMAQAPLGAAITLRLLSLDDAIARETAARARVDALRSRIGPRIRDPRDIPDLLRYRLTGGAISATADPFAGDTT
ncbi:MAG: urea amidolyase [Marinibacterium sp.]|nr:urea amidolyase [Marinibacterium sp.]